MSLSSRMKKDLFYDIGKTRSWLLWALLFYILISLNIVLEHIICIDISNEVILVDNNYTVLSEVCSDYLKRGVAKSHWEGRTLLWTDLKGQQRNHKISKSNTYAFSVDKPLGGSLNKFVLENGADIQIFTLDELQASVNLSSFTCPKEKDVSNDMYYIGYRLPRIVPLSNKTNLKNQFIGEKDIELYFKDLTKNSISLDQYMYISQYIYFPLGFFNSILESVIYLLNAIGPHIPSNIYEMSFGDEEFSFLTYIMSLLAYIFQRGEELGIKNILRRAVDVTLVLIRDTFRSSSNVIVFIIIFLMTIHSLFPFVLYYNNPRYIRNMGIGIYSLSNFWFFIDLFYRRFKYVVISFILFGLFMSCYQIVKDHWDEFFHSRIKPVYSHLVFMYANLDQYVDVFFNKNGWRYDNLLAVIMFANSFYFNYLNPFVFLYNLTVMLLKFCLYPDRDRQFVFNIFNSLISNSFVRFAKFVNSYKNQIRKRVLIAFGLPEMVYCIKTSTEPPLDDYPYVREGFLSISLLLCGWLGVIHNPDPINPNSISWVIWLVFRPAWKLVYFYFNYVVFRLLSFFYKRTLRPFYIKFCMPLIEFLWDSIIYGLGLTIQKIRYICSCLYRIWIATLLYCVDLPKYFRSTIQLLYERLIVLFIDFNTKMSLATKSCILFLSAMILTLRGLRNRFHEHLKYLLSSLFQFVTMLLLFLRAHGKLLLNRLYIILSLLFSSGYGFLKSLLSLGMTGAKSAVVSIWLLILNILSVMTRYFISSNVLALKILSSMTVVLLKCCIVLSPFVIPSLLMGLFIYYMFPGVLGSIFVPLVDILNMDL